MTPERRSRLALTLAAASAATAAAVVAYVVMQDEPAPAQQPINMTALALWSTLSTSDKARVCDYAATTPDPWEDIQWNADITKAEWGDFVAYHCAWPVGVQPK